MDKKNIGIIVGIIAIIAAIVVVICMGGTKLEEVKLSRQIDFLERTVSVSVGYPKNKGITVEKSDVEYSTELKNEKNNYNLEITITEDANYEDNKDYAKEEEGYEEAKFGNYSGYLEKGEYDIEGYILLEDLSDQNSYIYITFELEPIESTVNDKDVDPKTLYDLDEVQKILKSIKYDKGEGTTAQTKEAIEKKEEEESNLNYGEFKERPRTSGTSDKEGLIFIPSYESPVKETLRPEQRNDNVGIDNYLWYTSEDSAYTDSCIEVRVFPKTGTYNSLEEYKEKKGDMYHWSKATIAGTEYDVYEFGTDSTKPAKYSDYYNGAFMVGNKVVEFSYTMFAEIPNQDKGEEFFKQIIESIEYSEKFKE